MDLLKFFEKTIEYSFYLLLFFVPIIFTPWNFELFEYNKMMLTYGLTAIIVGAWLGKIIVEKKVRIQKTPLDIPILLFLISSILSTVFSIHPYTSLWGYYSRFHGGLISTISYILLYYAFVSNMTKAQSSSASWRRIKTQNYNTKLKNKILTTYNLQLTTNCIYMLLISALLVTFYGTLEHLGIDAQYWVQDVKNRVFSTLGQPNWLSAFINALICIPIALALQDNRRMNSANTKKEDVIAKFISCSTVCCLLFAVYYLCLLFTGSRSGIFGFLAAFLAFLGLLQFIKEKHFVKKVFSLLLPTILFALVFLKEWKGKQLKFILPAILAIGTFYLLNIEYLLWAQIKTKDLAKKVNCFLLIFIVSSLLIGTPLNSSFGKIIKSKLKTKSAGTVTQQQQKARPKYAPEISESANIRKVVWQGAIAVWRHWPVFGSGLETFAYSYYNFRPRAHNDLSEWDFLYNKAHNEYLNILACQGIVGLGTYLLLIGWFLKISIQYLVCSIQEDKKSSLNTKYHILYTAILAGYISILITNFFGFSVVIIGLFFFLFPAFCFVLTNSLTPENSYSLILGDTIVASKIKLSTAFNGKYLKNLSKKQRGKLKKKGYQLPVTNSQLSIYQQMFLIFLLATGYWLLAALFNMWRADYFFAKSDKYQNYNLVSSLEYIQKAIQLNPNEPSYHDLMAKVAAKTAVAYQQADASGSAQIIEQLKNLAVEESSKTLLMNPIHLNFYRTQAQTYLYLSLIDPTYKLKVIDLLLTTVKLSPTDAKLYFNLGKFYESSDDLTNAIFYLEKAVQLKPNYRAAHLELAKAYEKAELFNKAIAEYRFNLEMIDPEDKLSENEIQRLIKKR